MKEHFHIAKQFLEKQINFLLFFFQAYDYISGSNSGPW